MAYYVLQGKRPDKPENASAIAFSDSLWDLTERCWDERMASRPEVGEVVRRLGGAAANWNGLIPPCIQTKAVASGPGGASDSMKRSEFVILILPRCSSSSNGTCLLPEGHVVSQSSYQLLWDDVITAINKAKAVRASAGATLTSSSEGTSDVIKYGKFEILILP